MARWRCRVCGYVYDEDSGDRAGGINPGTRFLDLPSDWRCPVCRAEKTAFSRIDMLLDGGVTTTVSDVIVDELARWGVSVVFSIPGTSSLGIIDAIRKRSDMRYIAVRHEENAALAASAFNKLTGKIAACVTIAGPGATNLATGLYDAKEDHAAVISINGQVETQYSGPGGFQEIDQDAFFRPITVFNNTIYDKNMTLRLLTMALRHASIQRGVAQISVPNDIQKEPLDPRCCIRESRLEGFPVMPPAAELRKAADRINRAVKPVIIAGWGAWGLGEMVGTMASLLKAPILTTFRAKGILPDDHPWVFGILGNVGAPAARSLVESADLLITLGAGFSKMTGIPLDVPMVQVDIDPMKLGKGPDCVPVWGNCAYVLPELLPLLTKREDGTAQTQLLTMKGEWQIQLGLEADESALPIRPPYIMKVLSDVIPADGIISIDVGENGWWFGRNFRTKGQNMIMSGYLATMGFALPGAIAAKIAYPERQVFCITGDGGFAMAMAEFLTAVKYELPIVVVILNNHQLGMIQVEQMMEDYPNFGTDLHNPDFSHFAESCGGAGFRVESPKDLRDTLIRAGKSSLPVIVDIETDKKRFP
ncbi:MAG: thiamine pyrophosphate-binding protein [Methanoregulaceae archaeon]|nr:thiamine pyrophosphate-binding protein [Methanoregulaceae archaeon]